MSCLDAAHAAYFIEDSDDMLIHQRCLHFSPQRLAASSTCTKNLLHPNIRLHNKCEPCVRGGMKRPSTSTKRTTGADDPRRAATKFGDLVYLDTCSLPPSIPFGYIGWVVFLDHATFWLWLSTSYGATRARRFAAAWTNSASIIQASYHASAEYPHPSNG